jgi:hypothetical protein
METTGVMMTKKQFLIVLIIIEIALAIGMLVML